MARSLLDPEARRAIVDRVRRLAPDSPRQWGRMDSAKMLAHVADQLRVALGEIPFRGVRGPLLFRLAPVRFLLLHVLPWPKGRAKAPREAFTTVPAEWEEDRAALLELIERFGAAAEEDLQPLHPLFGRMSHHDLGVLSYRHLDHHLRQFGV